MIISAQRSGTSTKWLLEKLNKSFNRKKFQNLGEGRIVFSLTKTTFLKIRRTLSSIQII